MKKYFYAIFAFICTFLIIIIILYASFNKLNLKEDYLLDVNKGDSVYTVAMHLKNEGVISNTNFFKIMAKIYGKSKVQKGVYEIKSGDNVVALVKKLASGRVLEYPIVIPEGMIIKEVAMVFQKLGLFTAEDFIEATNNLAILQSYNLSFGSLEGFLYPATYSIPSNYNAQDCVNLMVRTFFKKHPEMLKLSEKDLYKTLILASIVEKEYKRTEEAPKIASVFLNRIDKRMRLQSCATVVYVLKEYYSIYPTRLYYHQLEIDNPFNTYRKMGLPPAPICNPGSVAINAALNPEETNYLYFVLKNVETGEHIFTNKFNEHVDAKLKYIK